jgi:hypothetical protein
MKIVFVCMDGVVDKEGFVANGVQTGLGLPPHHSLLTKILFMFIHDTDLSSSTNE